MSEVRLSAAGRPDVSVSAHAWVNKQNSPRVFFEGAGLLPSQTPAGLKDLRQQELDIIKVCLSQNMGGLTTTADNLVLQRRWRDR